MGFGLLSVLKMVPWVEVINRAPEIADGARKLWRAVAKRSPAAEAPAGPPPELSPENQSLAMLQTKLAATEAAVANLQQQMLQSTELINALAEQNAQLVKRMEVSGRRVFWLAGIMALFGVIAAIILVITLSR